MRQLSHRAAQVLLMRASAAGRLVARFRMQKST